MDIISLLVACLISLIIFTWLVNVLRATARTAVAIALIVLLLQILFGIGPSDLTQMVSHAWNSIARIVLGQP